MVELAATPSYDEGESRVIQSACGGIAAATKSVQRIQWIDLSLTITNPDVDAVDILTSGTSIATAGSAYGYVYPAVGNTPGNGVILEVWSKAIVLDHQADPFPGSYWRWIYPKAIFSFNPGSINNEAMSIKLDGFCMENANAGSGPLSDWPSAASLGQAAYFRDHYRP